MLMLWEDYNKDSLLQCWLQYRVDLYAGRKKKDNTESGFFSKVY